MFKTPLTEREVAILRRACSDKLERLRQVLMQLETAIEAARVEAHGSEHAGQVYLQITLGMANATELRDQITDLESIISKSRRPPLVLGSPAPPVDDEQLQGG